MSDNSENGEQISGQISHRDLLERTTDIVASYVANNKIAREDVIAVVKSVHATLSALGSNAGSDTATTQKPAVAIKRSIQPDYIVCLEDGKKLKMLKRHLRTAYGMTPEDYRAKWNLPSDYPMVAPNYAKQRSAFAKKIGLGKK